MRTSILSLSFVIACLGFGPGCEPKAKQGTATPGESGSGGDESGNAANGGEQVDVSQKVCDAEVSDTPTALFDNNVFLRTPKNVELVEQNPFFAMTMSKPVSTCDAIVDRMAVAIVQSDPKKDLHAVAENFLGANGYTGAGFESEEGDKQTNLKAIVSLPEGPKGEPPAKIWMTITRKYGKDFVLFYQTHPNAWNAVHKSFALSSERLIIKPPPK